MYLETSHATFTSKVLYFQPCKRLGENVSILLISADISQLDNISVNHLSYVVVGCLNVLWSIVEDMINKKFDAALVITINHCGT